MNYENETADEIVEYVTEAFGDLDSYFITSGELVTELDIGGSGSNFTTSVELLGEEAKVKTIFEMMGTKITVLEEIVPIGRKNEENDLARAFAVGVTNVLSELVNYTNSYQEVRDCKNWYLTTNDYMFATAISKWIRVLFLESSQNRASI